ncbi:MAG TPA: M48 family metalloprotease [Micromonosporaceae bacterium]|jgi:Zn-dependent protease with chaperone function
MRIRVAAAIALLGGFYIVGIVVCGCAVWLAIEVVARFGGAVAQDVTFAAGALVLGLSVPIIQLIRARPEIPDGVIVTEDAAPGLWRMVGDVAAAVGEPVPDEIRLISAANAAAFEEAGRFGLRRGRRYLYLGVPLLTTMTATDVRAIVAHELGHFGGGHTVTGAAIYRAGRTMVQTLEQLSGRLAGALLAGYVALYFYVALAEMRRTELEADAAAAGAIGAEEFGRALSAIPRVQAAWDATIDRCARSCRLHDSSPEDLLLDLRLMMAQTEDPAPRPATKWSTHPPLAERLRALSGQTASIGADQADPAIDRSLMLEALDAETLLLPAAAAMAERDGQRLLEATDARRPGLGGVLDLLETENAGLLAYLTETTVADSVFALAGTELVGSGQAYWDLSWGRRLTLHDRDGQPLVARYDPDRVPQLRALLQDWGCDVAAAQPLQTGSLAAGPTLADRLYDLVRRYGRPNRDVLQAALAAAAIADLRTHQRVRLAGDTTVEVIDRRPIGDPFLDSVLAMIRPEPAYRLLQRLGPQIESVIVERFAAADVTDDPRDDIIAALRSGAHEGPAVTLGTLLWGLDQVPQVVGRRALAARFWLGRLAARDPLMVAIRVVIGLYMPLPSTPAAGN